MIGTGESTATLGMARSTVGAVLRRLGLGKLKIPGSRSRLWSATSAARPGEMIHLDIKKLGKIKGVGHRFAPRGPAACMATRATAGTSCTSVLDDASRLAYTEILPSEVPGPTTTAFLERGAAWLALHGVTVERVMTDNGPAYTARALQGHPRRARRPPPPHTALSSRTNGKAERFIQTRLSEWLYARPYASSAARTPDIRPGSTRTITTAPIPASAPLPLTAE